MLTNQELDQLQYEARKRNAQIRYAQCDAKSGEVRPAAPRYMSPATARVVNRRLRAKDSPWVWAADGTSNDMIEPSESEEHVERLLALAKKASRFRPINYLTSDVFYGNNRMYNAWLYSVKD